MQVPVKNPGVGMQGMGGVGADNYRDLYNFGGAVQHAGNSLLAEAQRRKKREDDAFVRDAVNQAQTRCLEESKGIFGKSSIDAKNAPEEMDKLLQGMRKDLEKNLQNVNQRRAFEDAWASLSSGAKGRAIIHRDKQMDIYDKQTHLAQNLTVAKKSAEAILQPGGVEAVLLAMADGNTGITGKGVGPLQHAAVRFRACLGRKSSLVNASMARIAPALTETEWLAVQTAWDAIGEYHPLIDEMTFRKYVKDVADPDSGNSSSSGLRDALEWLRRRRSDSASGRG